VRCAEELWSCLRRSDDCIIIIIIIIRRYCWIVYRYHASRSAGGAQWIRRRRDVLAGLYVHIRFRFVYVSFWTARVRNTTVFSKTVWDASSPRRTGPPVYAWPDPETRRSTVVPASTAFSDCVSRSHCRAGAPLCPSHVHNAEKSSRAFHAAEHNGALDVTRNRPCTWCVAVRCKKSSFATRFAKTIKRFSIQNEHRSR